MRQLGWPISICLVPHDMFLLEFIVRFPHHLRPRVFVLGSPAQLRVSISLMLVFLL